MAVGDSDDIIARLKSVLPGGWFPSGSGSTSPTPVLDGLLTGMATLFAWLYEMLIYIKMQTRIITSTDGWLDITSTDYFGTSLPRNSGEDDAAFANRILSNLPPQGATRQALINVIRNLTGYDPIVTELWVPGDTGAYDQLGGYDLFGAYSGSIPYQGFVTIIRKYLGLPWISGYDAPMGGYDKIGGGLMYADLSMAKGYVSDAAIFAVINKLHAFGTVIWARFQITVEPSPSPVPPNPPTPQPAYVGGYGPIVVGGVTFGLNAYDIPSASAYS